MNPAAMNGTPSPDCPERPAATAAADESAEAAPPGPTPGPTPGEIPGRNRRRVRRVAVLLMAIVILSLLDLILTLTYLRTIGMYEANPIARALIVGTGSAVSLTSFKLLTVLICVVAIFRIRHYPMGEAGAWVGAIILAALSIQWHLYSVHIADPESIGMAIAGAYDDIWVRLD